MEAAHAGFDGIEIFFLICATAGGILVAVRFVLMFLGAGDHGGMDIHVDSMDIHIDTPVDDMGQAGDMHVDSDMSFKLLSLHGLSSFFLMFGLVGLALYRASRVGELIAIAGAVLGGLVSVWIIGKIFGMFNKFQASGTINLKQSVGCEGTVYLTIPQDGIGRVTVNINNRQLELDARSKDGAPVATGEAVQVVELKANVLVVEKIQEG